MMNPEPRPAAGQVDPEDRRPRILVIVPAYRCAPQVRRVLAQIDSRTASHVTEVVVFDNRSPDDTAAAAQEGLDSLPVPGRLVRNQENYGLGGSQKAGFLYASQHGFDYVVVLHGDDQARLSDFLPVFESGLLRDHDAILGSRFARGAQLQGYSWFRKYGNIVFNTLFSVAAGTVLTDLGSGLNCYRVSKLADRFFMHFPDDLTFNYFLILGQSIRGWKLRFFPISWREEDQISNLRIVRQTKQLLKLLALFSVRREAFLFAEHRETVREAYPGDVLFENAAAIAQGRTA